jgi:hypothetical protein
MKNLNRNGRGAGALALLALLPLTACLSGCGTMEAVQPWQKGMLAQPAMRFGGAGSEARFAAHTYDSKEAASGSGSVGGGGCGCN